MAKDMQKLIEVIIAGVFFCIAYFLLTPLLPVPASTYVGYLIVVMALVFVLGEVSGYNWPWRKK